MVKIFQKLIKNKLKLNTMKEFFKKLWEKIKVWIKPIWEKIKAWAKLTALPWLKKSWMQIVNIIVVFIAYTTLDNLQAGWATVITAIWLFLLLGYYIFWKLFGAEKAFKKKKEESKPVAQKPVKKTTKKK